MLRWKSAALLLVLNVIVAVRGDDNKLPVAGTTTSAIPGPKVYHGIIKEDAEDGTPVELDKPLFIQQTNGAVCGFTVFKTGALPVPFQVLLTDANTGRAEVILAKDKHLNFELTQSYQFDIAADDCNTGAHSPIRDTVHIEVEDVNDFAPVWREPSYMVEASEGLLYQKLFKLEAIDGDGSEQYSKICSYSLLTTGVPFRISDDGYLQNTEPLDYSSKHNYILEVVAEDCAHKRSDKLLVNIIVKPECRIGWKGVKTNVDYKTVSSRISMTENASLELCDAMCNITEVTVSLKLIHESPQQPGCALDKDSVAAREQFCGVKDSAMHLLPESPVESVVFDGKTVAYDVKPETFNGRLGKRFTLSTWMKHLEETPESEEIKQHLICNADGEGMNRHHYSLFVHNCRLVLLLRREPGEGDPDVFLPAEWRWKLPEVCDGKWHHYALTMESLQARLYVDGRLIVNGKHNPDVIDDWPLHASKRAHGMKLVVGACWEGGPHKYGQHFKGELSNMKLINNDTEDDEVIQCVNTCHEKLDFHAIADMEPGMSISMNSELSQLTVTGHNKQSVEKLLNRVGYVNPAMRKHGANSLVVMDTSVTCEDKSHVSVGSASTVIYLSSEAKTPGPLNLAGSQHLTLEEKDLLQGQRIFADISVIDAETSQAVDAAKRTLNSCVVHVTPDLDPLIEKIQYSEELSREHNVKITSNLSGLDIIGPAKIMDFETVLRNVYYHNEKPFLLKSRSFSLMCAVSADLTTTNHFIVDLSVIHVDKQQAAPVAAGHAADSKFEQAVFSMDEGFNFAGAAPVANLDGVDSASSSGAGMVFVAVFSVGFLLFIIVVVVLRIRSTHLRSGLSGGVNLEDKQEMEWDNSALTITVNPMDRDDAAYDETELAGLHTMTHDSDDDDIGSYHDDGSEPSDDDDEHVETEIKGLEWDNTHVSY